MTDALAIAAVLVTATCAIVIVAGFILLVNWFLLGSERMD